MVESREKAKGEIITAVENLIDEARVLNFSDAVFAFAATLLVLKIELPGLAANGYVPAQLSQALIDLWPSYFINIVSFLMIGYYWLNHHAIFELIRKFNKGIVWINVVFLIFLSFLPFPVDVYGDFPMIPVVVAFYSASLAVVGAFLALIWSYAVKTHALKEGLSPRHIRYYTIRMWLAPVVFAIAVPIAAIDVYLAHAAWLFVIIGIIIINKKYKYKRMSDIEKASI